MLVGRSNSVERRTVDEVAKMWQGGSRDVIEVLISCYLQGLKKNMKCVRMANDRVQTITRHVPNTNVSIMGNAMTVQVSGPVIRLNNISRFV